MSANEGTYDGMEYNSNVTIKKDCNNFGGNLEVEDTIYSDKFISFSLNTPILLANSIFNSVGSVIITSTTPVSSCSTTTASLTVNGGILVNKDSVIKGILRICNTTNSVDTSSGSLIVSGGASIYQNLSLNGILNIFNSTPSTSSSGSIITLGGITISNTTNATNISNGGALTVLGGASILGDLYSNNFYVNVLNTTYGNFVSITSANINISNGNFINISSNSLISTNISSNNISTNNLISLNGTFSNLYSNNASFGNTIVINEMITNLTVNNLYNNNAFINNINATSGYINILTIGNLYITNEFEYNDFVMNLSSANVASDFSSIGSLQLTTGTFGTLHGIIGSSSLYSGSISTSNLRSISIISTNISTANLTVSNAVINTASINNLTTNNSFTTNLSSNFAIITSGTISNLFSSSGNFISINSINSTSGRLFITNTEPSITSTTGALISAGGITVNNTTDVTSLSSGGGLTIAGGASIMKSLLVGNTISSTVISTGSIYSNLNNTNNFVSIYSTTSSLFLTSTQPSLNSTTGALVSAGGISIFNTTDVTSLTSGGGLTIAGGASIAKSLLVGGTIGATLISAGSAIINNLNTTTFTAQNALLTNVSISNLNIASQTVSNLFVINSSTANANFGNISSSNLNSSSANISDLTFTNGSYGNLVGNYFTANYITNNISLSSQNATISTLNSNNSSIQNIQITNGTFGGLIGNNFDSYTGSIGTLLSVNASISNLYNTNNTTINQISTNITTGSITGTNANFRVATIGTLNAPNIISNSLSIGNLNVIQISVGTLNVTSETVGNSYIINLTNGNAVITNSTIQNVTNINIISSNGSFVNISSGNANIINLFSTNGSFVNISSENIYSNSFYTTNGTLINSTLSNTLITNSTITNIFNNAFVSNYSTISNLYNSNGNITNITNVNLVSTNSTFTNLLATNNTSINLTVTNGTITTLNATGATFGNINFTGTLYQNGLPYIASQWTSFGPNIAFTTGNVGINTTNPTSALDVIGTGHFTQNVTIDGNISTSNIYASNISVGNINNAISISSQILSSTNVFTTNLSSANSILQNVTTNNELVNSSTISNLNLNSGIANNILINGSTPSFNSTTGTLILQNGGISVNCTVNSTGISSGGAATLAGGLAVLKDTYIGGDIHITGASYITGNTWLNSALDLNQNVINNVTAPSVDLQVANKWYVDNRFTNFTVGNVNGNFTQGQVIIATTGGNITGFNNFTFDGIKLNLFSTADATSLTNGGSLQVYGGASINLNLYVGGNAHILGYLDMNNQTIMSVATPTMPYDAANKYYVDDRFNQFTIGNVSGNFTQGQVIVATTGGNITGFSNFLFDGNLLSLNTTTNSLGLGSGGALNVVGGSSFLGNVYFGSAIDLNSNVINNVTSPSFDLQVANKWYVDDRFNQFTIGNVSGNFTQGQVIVATTGGNITGFSNFLFDGDLLSLTSTTNSIGLGSGGSLNINGGSSFLGNAYFGSSIDLNSQVINNVTAPSLNLQAANKWYVDLAISAANTINGNFSAGQIIIGGSSQGTLVGYPNFIYDGSLLTLSSTTNSLGLGTGGALNIAGGASILGNVYIGSGLDVNNNIITSVALPINPSDAVNKEYVDYYTGFNPGDIRERSFVLNNNVNTPTDVTGFIFLNTQISSFEAIVYLQIPELNIYDQWEIHGLLKGNVWIINTPFIGDHPSRVSFTITNSGQIQYTNENTTGTATIRFRAYTTSQGLYTNTTVANNLRSVPFGGTGTDFFTHGTLLIGNGTNAINTNINLRFTSGTLFVGNTINSIGINASGTIITNVTAPTLNLDVANKWYVDQATLGFLNNTYTNLIATNATVTTLNVGNLTTGNILVSGNITVAGNLIVLGTLTSVNITTVNLVETNVSAGLLNAGSATITNLITTNISTGTINSIGLTTGNINFTGSLYQNGVPYLGSQWTGSVGSTISYTSGNVLIGTTLTSTNTTTINLVATNSTITNAFISNANITTLSLANLVVTNETFSNLIGINANISNITVSNQVSLNETIGSLRATNINTLTFTSGNAVITNNITSKNILITGTTNANNILTIDCFNSQTFGGQILFRGTNSTGDFRVYGDGGDVQWLGGGSRAMQFGSFHQVIITGGRNNSGLIPQVGGNGPAFNCQILNTNNSIGLQVRGVAAQTVDLLQWITSTNQVLSRVDSLGRIGINSTTLATGQSTTGSIYTLGGAIINQNLYVNSTTNSTSTTTGGLIVRGGVGIGSDVNIGGILRVNNLSSTNITSTNILSTNITSSNLSSTFITTTNLYTTFITTTNLYTTFITSTNLYSLNITSSNLYSLNITSSNLSSSSISTINLLSSNLLSSSITTTNLVSTNITTSNLSSTNISNTNITSTNVSSNFITSSNISSINISSSNMLSTNISSSNISTSNMFINNVNMTPSPGDLFKEQVFNASDTVLTPDSITGFVFNNNVRYFTAWLSVFITATTNIVTAFTIEGIQLNPGVWEINTKFIGNNSKIKLSITNAGQIQYTCPDISGFVSSVMKFRAITTTI